METINDLIGELQNLKSSLRELPVVIIAPNGLEFKPKVKVFLQDKETMFDKPKKMIITYEQ